MKLELTPILGLIILLVIAGLLVAYYVMGKRKRTTLLFRDIPAFTRLKQVVGLAVEAGTRVHVTLGKGGLIGEQSAPALVGLSMLERIARAASVSDRPPLASSGDGAMAVLAQDTLHSAYRAMGVESQYAPNFGRFLGPAAFPYAGGAISPIYDEQASANILIGRFGSEAALISDAAERKGSLTVAGTDDISGQVVLYATAEEPLIGEEVFAGGAYLGAGSMHEASLKTQDTVRLMIIVVIVVGVLLKILGLDTLLARLLSGG